MYHFEPKAKKHLPFFSRFIEKRSYNQGFYNASKNIWLLKKNNFPFFFLISVLYNLYNGIKIIYEAKRGVINFKHGFIF
jgi:hypothetical protein